jgi:protein-tyrosine phosphatase
VFGWFKKNKSQLPLPVVDIHSHLLAGLDDGAKSVDDAIAMIRSFSQLGYRKLVTTPHVMSDVFPNRSENILASLAVLHQRLAMEHIDIKVEAAAEYYLDETLVRSIKLGEPLLTIGGKHLLFETNFLSEPLNLKEFVFLASAKGYKPVLAHPERYLYIQEDIRKARDLTERGVLLQLNLTSLTGYYSRPAQATANKLIEQNLVHWLGSDCHHMGQMNLLQGIQKNKYLQKALALPLLNYSLE